MKTLNDDELGAIYCSVIFVIFVAVAAVVVVVVVVTAAAAAAAAAATAVGGGGGYLYCLHGPTCCDTVISNEQHTYLTVFCNIGS